MHGGARPENRSGVCPVGTLSPDVGYRQFNGLDNGSGLASVQLSTEALVASAADNAGVFDYVFAAL